MLEEAIMLFIQNTLHNSYLSGFMILISFLGNYGNVWIVLSLSTGFIKKDYKVNIYMIIALLLVVLFVDIIFKELFQRIRPFDAIEGIKALIKKPQSSSFPSGHAASSFAAAFVLSKYIKKHSVYFFVLAFLIAISRVYLMVHYPSDIFAGMILGSFIGIGVSKFSKR